MSDGLKTTNPSVLKKLVANLGSELGGLVGQKAEDVIIGKADVKQNFERVIEGVKNHIGSVSAGVVGQEIQDMVVNGVQTTLQSNEKTLTQMTKSVF